MGKQKILITGASGFLGGIIADDLTNDYDVSITYNQHQIQINRCKSYRMNFFELESVQKVVQDVQPQVIVHCAAQPNGAICQADPRQAERVNVQGTLQLLNALPNQESLFVYISTDLVFEGNRSYYSEIDSPKPVSIYGKTKLRAEQIVQSMWRNHIILRPALMYGPVAPSGKGSFVQWMDNTLKQGLSIKLFDDEFRTPLYAPDVSKVIRKLLLAKSFPHRIFNLGGPERISRIEFGNQLAELRGYDKKLLQPIKLSEMSTGYPRPADVSMNSQRVQETFGIELSPIWFGLESIF